MNDLNQRSLKTATPKPSTTTPRKTFITLLVITAIIFIASTIILSGSDTSLTELTMYEGKLSNINVTTTRQDQGKPSTPIIVFTIEGLQPKLGIGQNAPADFSIYTDNLKVGDIVKIYYLPRLYQTPEGYSPFVYQLEKDGVALLDVNEVNKSYKRGGYIGFGIGIVVLIISITYYRRNVAKSTT